jgi:hypothetical protein
VRVNGETSSSENDTPENRFREEADQWHSDVQHELLIDSFKWGSRLHPYRSASVSPNPAMLLLITERRASISTPESNYTLLSGTSTNTNTSMLHWVTILFHQNLTYTVFLFFLEDDSLRCFADRWQIRTRDCWTAGWCAINSKCGQKLQTACRW